MAENSKIEWTTHTFNPWTGCTAVSPACDHCYAEGWAKRSGHVQWGPHGERRRTKTWGNPVKWNRQAEGTAERPRVFCASLADVFDNHRSIEDAWRRELWTLIRQTPNLDWLLLTKRPQNIARYLPDDWGDGYPNVWLGTTVENQTEADRRIPHLLKVPARVRFLSCEPLLGPVNLRLSLGWLGNGAVNWVIAGGESGPHHRQTDPNWFRHLRGQCADRGVPFLFKQWDGRTQAEIKAKGRALDGVVHDGYPAPTPTQRDTQKERRMSMESCPCFDETVNPCPRCGATLSGDDSVNGICQADFMDKAIGDEIERLNAENEKLRRLLTAAVYGPWWPSTDAEARAALAQKEGE